MKLTIDLPVDVFEALMTHAIREHRSTAQQAAYMLTRWACVGGQTPNSSMEPLEYATNMVSEGGETAMRDLPARGEPNHGRRLVDIVAPQASFLREALAKAWRAAPLDMRLAFLRDVLTAEERATLAEMSPETPDATPPPPS